MYSLAYSTSTGMPARSSKRISATRPAWRLEPLAEMRRLSLPTSAWRAVRKVSSRRLLPSV